MLPRRSRLFSSSDPASTVLQKPTIKYSLRRGNSTSSLRGKVVPKKSAVAATLSEAKLERVLGCTACPSSFAIDQTSGMVAYAAGSTVVLLNKQNQQFHLVNNSKNNITCVAFSPNGRFIATGEFGHLPMVRVWEITREGSFQGTQVAELKNHALGILCVRFSNDSKYVISVGIQHDKCVAVWDWKQQKKVSENRLTSQVNAMDMGEDGVSFVTVGVRHVKFWVISNKDKTLSGRSAILSDQRNNTFLDVCCAPGNKTFALTNTGLLVEFHDKKLVNTYELSGATPLSLTLGLPGYLFMGFSNGIIRAINVETTAVHQICARPHPLQHDIAQATSHQSFFDQIGAASTSEATFPDSRALLFHKKTNTLTVLYSDRSIYQWTIDDEFRSSLIVGHRNHVGAIFDVEMVPVTLPWLPAGTFMTSGVDATIRFWSLDKASGECTGVLSQNILSAELKKILYFSSDVRLLNDQSDSHSGMIFNDPLESSSGIRCLTLSPAGNHLAAGFRDGNLCVFDITSDSYSQIITVEAHDGEMLCLEYADPGKSGERTFLASGGRDRLIHLYDADDGYAHLATVEDHSSSVNSIRFISIEKGFEMFTCATDRLVVIRRISYESDSSEVTLERLNQFSSASGLNYLITAPDGNLVAACQDRQLRSYTMQGKMMKQVKGTLCEEGTLTKLTLDPSGTYAATVCSDRYVYVIDIATGECAAVLNGQADCVTSIAFTPDCRRLVVVSHSGCVFVWRLSNMLTKRMTAKLGKTEASFAARSSPTANERCPTPDSVIESGSDSASFIGGGGGGGHGKKDSARPLNASGSEFGSITSLPIGPDDDLDSGVGGGQQAPSVSVDEFVDLNDTFSIRRLPTEVVRRGSSSFLNAPDLDADRTSPVARDNDPNNMLSHHSQQPSSYVASRSMSNLHRSNASPQRIRKKWNDDPLASTGHVGMPQPAAPPSNTSDYSSGSTQHVYQQPLPAHQLKSLTINGGGMNTSVSLYGLRSCNYDAPVSGPKNSFAPVPQRLPPAGTPPRHNPGNSPSNYHQDEVFDRTNANRNSLTKKFMNLSGVSTPEPKMNWSAQRFDNSRRPSNLFNHSTPLSGSSSGILRRQSERSSVSSIDANMETPQRLFKSRGVLGSGSSSNNFNPSGDDSPDSAMNVQLRKKLVDRAARRRLTVSAFADISGGGEGVSTPLSPLNSLPEEEYENGPSQHRVTSQSPSALLLNMEPDSSRSRTNLRKDSDLGSRVTLSSSRSNLRSNMSTTLNRSSQALNKILEARQMLKKSQENLSVTMGEDSPQPSSASSYMARSKSIGNLKMFTSRSNMNDSFNGTYDNYDSSLNDSKRMMARSVTSLHNGAGGNATGDDEAFMHPDECSLQSQYAVGSNLRQSSSRFSESIRNLKKLSNPDLLNQALYENGESSYASNGLDGSAAGHDPSATNAPAYYSTTLPKSLRKGAVSKRVYKANAAAARLDQTSESDSNASDQTPTTGAYGGYVKSNLGGSGFMRLNGPMRSASSVEAGRVAAGRRTFEPVPARKSTSYMAQKIFQQKHSQNDFTGPDNGNDDLSPRSPSANDVLTTDENAKKMSMHLYECIEQFNQACDKILGARQLIDSDNLLVPSDRDKLLNLVNRTINQGRNRLDASETRNSASRAISSVVGGNLSSRGNATAVHMGTSSPTPASPITIDNNFMNQYGPQIMQLLQQNMAKQN